MMKNTISLMKTLSMGLFIGAFVALFVSLVGSSGIFMYGVTHAPQHIHLNFLSQDAFDFSSTSKVAFEILINPQGMLYLIMVMMLLVAIVFSFFKLGFFRK